MSDGLPLIRITLGWLKFYLNQLQPHPHHPLIDDRVGSHFFSGVARYQNHNTLPR